MNLSNARVLVTGGSSGIGHGTARALLERGARVAICGRDADRLARAAGEIGALPIPADVRDEQEVQRLVREVVEGLGGYDILVNNAGVGSFAPLLETTAEDMRRVWETNVLGATLVARESARHFVEHGGGSIVNVASTVSQRAGAGGSAYASSKFAMAALTQAWRAELRKHDIRVMQVNPSEVITEFFGRAGVEQVDDPSKLHPRDIAQLIVAMLELDQRAFVTEATVWATNPSA